MKVYTEIVYTWDDNKGELVEESSKSFEYEGEVILCHRKRYPHPHGGIAGDLYEAGTTLGEGLADLGSDILGGTSDAANAALQVAKEKTSTAWGKMSEYGSDIWEKGGAAITELWKGTGMEEMAASWTDPTAMAEAWMPGKWSADSPFQSKWMMGLDMVKHMKGFNMGDFGKYKRDLFGDFDIWTAAQTEIQAGIDTAQDAIQDVVGDDPVGQIQEDIGTQADAAEDSINETIADANTGIETIIDENTDSLNDLESGINTSVADAVDLGETGIANVAIVGDALQDTATLAGEGVSFVTGATIDINNPNALVVSPQNWYEEWGIVSEWDLTGGDPDPFGLMDTNMDILGAVINTVYRPDLWGPFGDDGGGGGGGGSAQTGSGSILGQTNFEGLRGDPFGREGKERREIHQMRKFPQQVASAPSLVNQRRNLS